MASAKHHKDSGKKLMGLLSIVKGFTSISLWLIPQSPSHR